MNTISLSRRPRRVLGAGLAVAGLLVAALVAPTGAAAVAAQDCADGYAANHRVKRGTAPDHDPTHLSAAQVRNYSAGLAARVRTTPNVIKAKALRVNPKVSVPVWFHVIKNTAGAGAVTTAQINNQITVMNAAYASSGFVFTLAGTTTTVNNNWYSWSDDELNETDDDDAQAKDALHTGTYGTLNFYLAALEDGLLGYATFPVGNPSATTLKRDGVVLLNSSLPGGTTSSYNLGDTAVHEVGHWLSLFHTFQDGCTYANDHVQDTPAQFAGNNIFECTANANTCPLPGNDPVRNYMSYGTDPCLNNFTAGQGFRMRTAWWTLRAPSTTLRLSS